MTVTQLEFDETWIDHNWVKNVQAPRPSAACKAWHMAYAVYMASSKRFSANGSEDPLSVLVATSGSIGKRMRNVT